MKVVLTDESGRLGFSKGLVFICLIDRFTEEENKIKGQTNRIKLN